MYSSHLLNILSWVLALLTVTSCWISKILVWVSWSVLFPLQVDRSPSGNPLAWSCFERRQQAILAAVASPRFFARLSAGVSQSSA